MEPENPGLEVMKAAAEGAGREGVNKLANFFGAAAPFWGMRKKAVDVYVKAIENGDYTPEEKYMLIAGAKKHCKELENQMAIAEIAQNAAKEGTDFSMESHVDDEWLSRFMDAGKFVSDEETQLLWGNVLAGEFETPGSTPPSIIRILSELTKNYATVFSAICSLQADILIDDGTFIQKRNSYPFICSERNNPYLRDLGITFSSLQELDGLGLIDTNFASGYVSRFDQNVNLTFHIVSQRYVITVTECKNNELPIGHVRLTEAGRRISRFVPRQHNIEHMRAIKAMYAQNSLVKCLESPSIEITKVTGEGIDTVYNYSRKSPEQQQTSEQQ